MRMGLRLRIMRIESFGELTKPVGEKCIHCI